MVVIDLNDYPENLSCQKIARRLLEAGHNQQTQLAFVRGKTPIFQSFDTIGYFANTKAIESHNGDHMMRIKDPIRPYISPQEKPNDIKSRAA